MAVHIQKDFKSSKNSINPFNGENQVRWFSLPEIGVSCMEEPPIWVSGTTAFEDEAVCLAFGAIVIKDPMLDEGNENKESSFLKP